MQRGNQEVVHEVAHELFPIYTRSPAAEFLQEIPMSSPGEPSSHDSNTLAAEHPSRSRLNATNE